MKEYKTNFDSFIGGWFIPDKICDDLIKYFKKNKKYSFKGTQYSVDGELIVDIERKQSTDLAILPNNFEPPFFEYREYLQKCLEKYIERYPESANTSHFNINGTYQIQHYPPGGGFKVWHAESTSKLLSSRHLVFMTYLNNVKNAGTEFKFQKLKTPCQKGLTLIWPSSFIHTHRGIISKTEEKYIITGWYTFT
jgi:hypothetical protein